MSKTTLPGLGSYFFGPLFFLFLCLKIELINCAILGLKNWPEVSFV